MASHGLVRLAHSNLETYVFQMGKLYIFNALSQTILMNLNGSTPVLITWIVIAFCQKKPAISFLTVLMDILYTQRMASLIQLCPVQVKSGLPLLAELLYVYAYITFEFVRFSHPLYADITITK